MNINKNLFGNILIVLLAFNTITINANTVQSTTTKFISTQVETESNTEKKMEEIYCLKGHTGSVLGVAFSPDGKHIASTSSDKTIRIWDTNTGKEIRQLECNGLLARCIEFFPDNRRLLSGHIDGTLRTWDIITGKELSCLKEHSALISSIALSSNGHYALSGGLDSTVRLWDLVKEEQLQEIIMPSIQKGSVYSIALSPDGHKIAVGIARTETSKTLPMSIKQTGTVCVWNLTILDGDIQISSSKELTFKDDLVTCVRFTPDGQKLLFANTGYFYLWDYLAEDNSRQELSLSQRPKMQLFVGHTKPGKVNKPGYEKKFPITDIVFSPDGQHVLSSSRDNTVRLWNVKTSKEVSEFSGHAKYVNSVRFSPDGSMGISGSEDNTLRLVHLTNTKTLEEIDAGINSQRQLSPDQELKKAIWPYKTKIPDGFLFKRSEKWNGRTFLILKGKRFGQVHETMILIETSQKNIKEDTARSAFWAAELCVGLSIGDSKLSQKEVSFQDDVRYWLVDDVLIFCPVFRSQTSFDQLPEIPTIPLVDLKREKDFAPGPISAIFVVPTKAKDQKSLKVVENITWTVAWAGNPADISTRKEALAQLYKGLLQEITEGR